MTTSTDYGAAVDWDASGPGSPMFPWVEGAMAVGKCAAVCLAIPSGSLEYWPDTVCLSRFVESNATTRTIQGAVERALRADERIESARVAVSRSDGDVNVKIRAYLSSGESFDLVMNASVAAVNLVSLQESE
jgi:hypothetical protein